MSPINYEACRPIRCAIYTRKSVEISDDERVNSLQTQREVCSAFVRCNAHLGWVELPTRYDDAGWSGSNLQRPAMTRLIADIESGIVQVVIFYKIDRLTRSLADFIRLIDRMNSSGVSFVSVTQAFDTSTSMGRLVLNILLTFAQFEREMLSDRIKDKFRSMRKQGLHFQGRIPLGYDKVRGKLEINEIEAAMVKEIFETCDQFPNLLAFEHHLQSRGVRGKELVTRDGHISGGKLITRGVIAHLLRNPIYIGQIRCEGVLYPGAHQSIIRPQLWRSAQAHLDAQALDRRAERSSTRLLQGVLKDDYGRSLHLREGGGPSSRLHYYQSAPKNRVARHQANLIRVRVDQIEALTTSMLMTFFSSPEQLRSFLLGQGFHDLDMRAAQRIARCSKQILLAASPAGVIRIFKPVVARAEVSRSEFRLFALATEILRHLKSVDQRLGSASSLRQPEAEVILLTAQAHLISAHRDFNLPFGSQGESGQIDRSLLNVLRRAGKAQECVLRYRRRPLVEHAANFKLGLSAFSRLLRLNYLAPDIKAAIADGTQPRDLTVRKLLYSALPLDWSQQRLVLGFAECTDT